MIGRITIVALATTFLISLTADGQENVALQLEGDQALLVGDSLSNHMLWDHFSLEVGGDNSTTSTLFSAAFGRWNTASESYATAFNHGNIASGNHSAALGTHCESLARESVAIGIGTRANSLRMIAFGEHNQVKMGNLGSFDDNDDIMVVGNGKYFGIDAVASDALTVKKSGQIWLGTFDHPAGPRSHLSVIDIDQNMDLQLVSSDDFFVNLDHNADNNNAEFMILNGGGDTVFQVKEDGTVLVNGVVEHGSDVERKENIRPVDPNEILTTFAQLPVYQWKDHGRQYGPRPGAFNQAFQLSENEAGISSVDADGVMLAVLQALLLRCDMLNSRIAQLKTQQ